MSRVVAHRGATGLEPENTLRSFRRAAQEGADAIELDLRVSHDGSLVIMHDPTVDRTTDGTGPVSGMSLAELQSLNAGLGERIPTFEEALEATDLPIHAELKEADTVEPLAKLIWRQGLMERVTVISFDLETLLRVRISLPSIPVGLILFGAPPEGIEQARSVDASVVSFEAAHLSTEMIERCREADLDTSAWTVNDPEQMRRMTSLGVDFVATDRPDLLAGILARR